MSYPRPRLVRHDGIVVGVASGPPTLRGGDQLYVRTLIVMAGTKLEPWDRGFYLEHREEELAFVRYEEAAANPLSTIYSGVTFVKVP